MGEIMHDPDADKMRDAILRLDLADKLRVALSDEPLDLRPVQPGIDHASAISLIRQIRQEALALAEKAFPPPPPPI